MAMDVSKALRKQPFWYRTITLNHKSRQPIGSSSSTSQSISQPSPMRSISCPSTDQPDRSALPTHAVDWDHNRSITPATTAEHDDGFKEQVQPLDEDVLPDPGGKWKGKGKETTPVDDPSKVGVTLPSPNSDNNASPEPYPLYSLFDGLSPETKQDTTIPPHPQSPPPPLPNAATKPPPTSDMLERMHIPHPHFHHHHQRGVAGPSSSGNFLGHRKLTKQRSLPNALGGIAGKATGFSDHLATAAYIREEQTRPQQQQPQNSYPPRDVTSPNLGGYASSSTTNTSTTMYLKLRFSPHSSSKHPTLNFDPVVRVVKPNQTILRIGRFADDESGSAEGRNAKKSERISFRSKVVSRLHAQIWCDENCQCWIRDAKSSSGTFLNNHRLSSPNEESEGFALNAGDVVQFGVDFQGGREEQYRGVRVKVEIEESQRTSRQPNRASRQARNVARNVNVIVENGPDDRHALGKRIDIDSGDCCICLFAVTTQQALFVAPCSHVFHFSCVRPLVDRNWPSFSCPLCRTVAYLAADVGKPVRQSTMRPFLLERDANDYGPIPSSVPQQIQPHAHILSNPPPAVPTTRPRAGLVTTPVPDAMRYSTERTDGVGVGPSGLSTNTGRPATIPVPDAVRYATEGSENIGGFATKTGRNGTSGNNALPTRNSEAIVFPGSTTNLNVIPEESQIEANAGRVTRSRNKTMSDMMHRKIGQRDPSNSNGNPVPLPVTNQTLISFPKDPPRQKVSSGAWGRPAERPHVPAIDTSTRVTKDVPRSTIVSSKLNDVPLSALQNTLADIRWTSPATPGTAHPSTMVPPNQSQSRFLERFD